MLASEILHRAVEVAIVKRCLAAAIGAVPVLEIRFIVTNGLLSMTGSGLIGPSELCVALGRWRSAALAISLCGFPIGSNSLNRDTRQSNPMMFRTIPLKLVVLKFVSVGLSANGPYLFLHPSGLVTWIDPSNYMQIFSKCR